VPRSRRTPHRSSTARSRRSRGGASSSPRCRPAPPTAAPLPPGGRIPPGPRGGGRWRRPFPAGAARHSRVGPVPAGEVPHDVARRVGAAGPRHPRRLPEPAPLPVAGQDEGGPEGTRPAAVVPELEVGARLVLAESGDRDAPDQGTRGAGFQGRCQEGLGPALGKGEDEVPGMGKETEVQRAQHPVGPGEGVSPSHPGTGLDEGLGEPQSVEESEGRGVDADGP
jgi:hypothetical protein